MDRWEVKMKKTFFFFQERVKQLCLPEIEQNQSHIFWKKKTNRCNKSRSKTKKLKLIIRRWLVCNSIAEVQATLSRHISVPEVANSKRMYFSFAQKTLSFLIQHKLREVSGPRNVFFIHVGFFNYWPPALHLLFSDQFFFLAFQPIERFRKIVQLLCFLLKMKTSMDRYVLWL